MFDNLPFSLARANIGYHWKLFLAAISVLTLSGCLIYVAVGISISNMRSYSAFQRTLTADLIVQKANPKNRRDRRVSLDLIYDLEAFPDVQKAEPVIRQDSFLTFKIDDQDIRMGFLVLNMDQDSMLVPRFFDAKSRAALRVPGNTIISYLQAQKHNIKIGDRLITPDNSGEVIVIGILNGELGRAGFMGDGYNFMSKDTAIILENAGRNRQRSPRAFMIKLKQDVDVDSAQTRISHYLKPQGLEAIKTVNFGHQASMDFLLDDKETQGFMVVGFFAILIPLFIVIQTLRSAILSQKIQFATLRALGIPRFRLVKIAMEQAFWVGILGTALSFCLALLIMWKLADMDIMMYTSKIIIIRVSIALMTAAMIAGLVSLFAVFKTHPQELLR